MTLPTTTQIQQALIAKHYLDQFAPNGKPNDDGDFGTITQNAIRNYEAANGLPVIGSQWSPSFLDSLFPLPPEPPSIFTDIGAVFSILQLLNALKGTKMDSTKPWYTSQTVWAGVLAIVGTALSFFHVGFSAEDQATVLSNIINIATAASTLYAIITRLLASHKLTS